MKVICPVCEKIVSAYVPSGGDGSGYFPYKHGDCEGRFWVALKEYIPPPKDKIGTTKCWSCGKKVEKKPTFCYGCNHNVCLSCVDKYGHLGWEGKHGRKRSPSPSTTSPTAKSVKNKREKK